MTERHIKWSVVHPIVRGYENDKPRPNQLFVDIVGGFTGGVPLRG